MTAELVIDYVMSCIQKQLLTGALIIIMEIY